MEERTAPRSLGELPFARVDPLTLLDLGPEALERDEPEHDYAGFGWTELDSLVLSSDDGERARIGPVLLLALHGVDDPPPDTRELELLFELPGEGEPLVVLAPLAPFLACWLPRLPATAPHVVLALCNPLGLELASWGGGGARPSLGSRTLHHAHGDVTSWLDVDERTGATDVRLHAHTWLRR